MFTCYVYVYIVQNNTVVFIILEFLCSFIMGCCVYQKYMSGMHFYSSFRVASVELQVRDSHDL